MSSNLRVMMATEGTYPFHLGGVSTWCDALINGASNTDFVLYAVLMNPFVSQKFVTPPNVTELIKVPLWGTEEPSEHLTQIPFSSVYLAKRRTNDGVIRSDFLPAFESVVRQVVGGEGESLASFAENLFKMYSYFRQYDYQATFKSSCVWETFRKATLDEIQKLRSPGLIPSLFELTESLGWLYRFFTVLNTPLPKVHVSHSAAAAFCGIPCVISKIERKTPYLLSEHGVYLREQYIWTARSKMSRYSKRFLLNLISTVSRMSYQFADQVSPVCEFNTRWERQMGVPDDRIKVIYNGVDPEMFSPEEAIAIDRKHVPTVACVARLDPIKDIETLIRSAAIVRNDVPEVKYICYGAPSSTAYFERLCSLRAELGLEETVVFAGHTSDVAAAYRTADVVALSSISEGFPYSVVEAMMSGKAVVATDVGGVKEALEGCGSVVPPRSPERLAKAIITLLKEESIREAFGRQARKKALEFFTVARLVGQYLESYSHLRDAALRKDLGAGRRAQALHAERGFAFAEAEMWREAITQFKQAIDACPGGPGVPSLLLETAQAYLNLGDVERARLEMEKADALLELVFGTAAA